MFPSLKLAMAMGLIVAAEGSAQGLTLDSLIGSGLRNNADLNLFRAGTEATAIDTLAATISPNPHFEAEAGYNLTDPGRPKAGAKFSREYQPGVRSNQSHASAARLAAAKEWQKSRELETRFAIRSAYFSWQIQDRKAKLQREAQARWENLARITAAKVKEGRLSQLDEAQARLNLAKARQRELGLLAEMGSLENRLAHLAGLASLPEAPAPDSLDSLPSLPPLARLTEMAMRTSPELRALDGETLAGRKDVQLEQALRNPTFTFSVGYEREAEGDNLIGAGIGLPLPLFNRNQAGIAKSKSGLRIAERTRLAAESRLRNEVAEIHGRLAKLGEQWRNHRGEIGALGLKQMELSEKGFLQGSLGIFDLSRVQEEHLSREEDALDILNEFYSHWNRLGKAVGGEIW
jgi:cobalt-zinc-cadmium efflux system outer membrane protein